MELQHINVKLLVKNSENIDLASVVPVFHRWIQGQVLEGRLLDIADYRHVPAGPGVILIGNDGDYSVDNTDGRLGVRYNRKAALGESNQDRLRQATLAALTACQWLEQEPSLGQQVRFNEQDFEIFINDRLLAPNSEETRSASKPDFDSFFEKLLGTKDYVLSFSSDPRRLFTVFLKTLRPIPLAQLSENLSS